jgi:hypothetical protein
MKETLARPYFQYQEEGPRKAENSIAPNVIVHARVAYGRPTLKGYEIPSQAIAGRARAERSPSIRAELLKLALKHAERLPPSSNTFVEQRETLPAGSKQAHPSAGRWCKNAPCCRPWHRHVAADTMRSEIAHYDGQPRCWPVARLTFRLHYDIVFCSFVTGGMLAKNASLRETAGRRKEKERAIFCEQKVEKLY